MTFRRCGSIPPKVPSSQQRAFELGEAYRREHHDRELSRRAVVFDRFERVVDPTLYQPLPADDLIGMTDVVNSTQAIKEGRYKAVNMAGAAAITAVMNAVPGGKLSLRLRR